MRIRFLHALALATALGSTLFIAVQAGAQQRGWGARMQERAAPMERMSAADRAAFLDARIAAIKAGLKLTPDQEKLWQPVEDAVRDGAKKMEEMAAQSRAQPQPSDPVDGLRRMADAASTRGDVMHKIADAAQPLYASLGEDQKRRLPVLMRGPRGPASNMASRMRQWWNGNQGPSPMQRQGYGGFGPDGGAQR